MVNILFSQEPENLCFIAVCQRNRKLWSFVHMTLKRLFAIDVSSWISTLIVMINESKRKNLPSNPFFSSWQTQWCKIRVRTLLHS